MVNQPEIKVAIHKGFTEAANRLGYGENGEEKVICQIERLAGELAYIEALRDYFNRVFRIEHQLRMVTSNLKGDKAASEEIVRIYQLIKRPLDEYRQAFARVDAQTAEVISVIRNISLVVKFIRQVRDELHEITMLWDDVLDQWTQTAGRSPREEYQKIRNLYQFLAQNFLHTYET